MERIDMRGKEYGWWLVLGPAPDKMYYYSGKAHAVTRWWCLCRGCKNVYAVDGSSLRAGKTRSCKPCWLVAFREFCDNR